MYWGRYLRECVATGTQPDVSDYSVWLDEQEIEVDDCE